MTANNFQECIRHMFNLYPKDFEDIFGTEMGQHLWFKFGENKQDIAKWICYLDTANMRLLYKHFENHLKKHGCENG